jgi:hypothetical protein
MNHFKDKKIGDLFLVMVFILAHGTIFYQDSMKEKTFVYFLVNPEFMNVFSGSYLNHMIIIFYYLFLSSFFAGLTYNFYRINALVHE